MIDPLCTTQTYCRVEVFPGCEGFRSSELCLIDAWICQNDMFECSSASAFQGYFNHNIHNTERNVLHDEDEEKEEKEGEMDVVPVAEGSYVEHQ